MADRIGQQLGNYRLLSLLGSGGFAEVYLGEHVYLKTQVAVKVLQTRMSGSEDMEGFLNEARTVARLSHPNIVRILDFGVDGETPFLVMDYAPSGTLRQRHTRGELLLLPTVTQYVKQVAEALQYAHDEKLIHRDVKPENILIGRRNEVLLSDFGIALAAQSSRYQSTQDVIGTVAYMSPEQIQGKPRPASDQYSLGIAVYEWLGGVRPFSGSFTELCTQHMFATVPPLREKVPAISHEVEQVVTTALAKDPKQRFGSVQAFANALEQASQLSPGVAKTALAVDIRPSIYQAAPIQQPQVQDASAKGKLQTPQSLITPQPITAPPIPPTQYAAPTPAPGVNPYPYPGSTPYQMHTQQPAVFPMSGKKENGWTLGKWHLLSMGVGTLIYFLLELALNKLVLGLDTATVMKDVVLNPIGGSFYLPSVVGLLYGLINLIPLFFGARFGPWVGLVVALGVLPADILTSGWPTYGIFWASYLFWPLLGFIPGIAFVISKSRARAKSQSLIGFGTLMGFVAMLINSMLQAIVYTVSSGNYANYLPNFSSLFLSYLGDIILLPVALVLSELIMK